MREGDIIFCPGCGAVYNENVNMCRYCGLDFTQMWSCMQYDNLSQKANYMQYNNPPQIQQYVQYDNQPQFQEEQRISDEEYYTIVWKNHFYILVVGLVVGCIALLAYLVEYDAFSENSSYFLETLVNAIPIFFISCCGVCAAANLLNKNTGTPSMIMANIIISVFNVFIDILGAGFATLFSSMFGIVMFAIMAAIDALLLVVLCFLLVLALTISAAIYLIECLYYFIQYKQYT